MHANEIDALYDRHRKVSPCPNPDHKASNSAKHEDIWKLQFIVCNMKYPRSQLRAFLDISGSFICSGAGFLEPLNILLEAETHTRGKKSIKCMCMSQTVSKYDRKLSQSC